MSNNTLVDNKEIKRQRMLSTEGKQLTENTYNITIGLTLLWGILINVGMAYFLTPYIANIDIRVMVVGYLVLGIACTALIFKSHKPAISFLGFTGLACVMGAMLTVLLTQYTTSTIFSAFITTGIIVVSMMIVSMIFPKFFLSLGRTLMFALIGAIVVEFGAALIFHLSLGYIDYIMVIIFAGFIGFDWAKAQAYPKTLDNAIDSAADIYVDVINIFVRILSIMGKKK